MESLSRTEDDSYRNTREITAFANSFRYGTATPGKNETTTPQGTLFPDPRISSGPQPEIKRYERYQQLIESVAHDIRKLVDSDSFPLSEIAVIYTMKKPDQNLSDSIPALVADALDRQGILHKWLSEDYRAKRSHDITANSVTISTIHSVKGLDFACVFLIGLDALEPDERWTEKQINPKTAVHVHEGH